MLMEVYRAKVKAAMSWVTQRRSRHIPTITSIVLGFACILFPNLGNAVEKSDILIVAIDVDLEALRKDDPVTRRTLGLLGEALIARGYGVTYDERFERRQQLGKRFLSLADDWMREARRARISTSAMVALKIYELADHRGDGQAVRFEILARLYRLPRGPVLHETRFLQKAGTAVPSGCNRRCTADAAVAGLETPLAKLADQLIERLPGTRISQRGRSELRTPGVREFELTFSGFSTAEMVSIERHLKTFLGYRKHDFIERGSCRHVVALLGRISRSRLESQFRRMLRELRFRDTRLQFTTLRAEARKSGCVG